MPADTMTLSAQVLSDMLVFGALGSSGNVSVCLGVDTATWAPGSTTATVTEASYPGYSRYVWDALPVTISGDTVSAAPATATFAGPSSGSCTLGAVYWMYKTGSGSVGLMAGQNLPGYPVVFNSPLVVISIPCSLADLDVYYSRLVS